MERKAKKASKRAKSSLPDYADFFEEYLGKDDPTVLHDDDLRDLGIDFDTDY